MVLKAHYPDCWVGHLISFYVEHREGKRPLATDVTIRGYKNPETGVVEHQGGAQPRNNANKGKGKHQAVVKGGGKGGKTAGKDAGKGKKVLNDTYFAGQVREEEADAENKIYVDCPEIYEMFGCEAFYYANQQPAGVAATSLIAFTVRENSEVGWPPHAMDMRLLTAGILQAEPPQKKRKV